MCDMYVFYVRVFWGELPSLVFMSMDWVIIQILAFAFVWRFLGKVNMWYVRILCMDGSERAKKVNWNLITFENHMYKRKNLHQITLGFFFFFWHLCFFFFIK
jgi:hypothetical protein